MAMLLAKVLQVLLSFSHGFSRVQERFPCVQTVANIVRVFLSFSHGFSRVITFSETLNRFNGLSRRAILNRIA
jgi:hypothetical protein